MTRRSRACCACWRDVPTTPSKRENNHGHQYQTPHVLHACPLLTLQVFRRRPFRPRYATAANSGFSRSRCARCSACADQTTSAVIRRAFCTPPFYNMWPVLLSELAATSVLGRGAFLRVDFLRVGFSRVLRVEFLRVPRLHAVLDASGVVPGFRSSTRGVSASLIMSAPLRDMRSVNAAAAPIYSYLFAPLSVFSAYHVTRNRAGGIGVARQRKNYCAKYCGHAVRQLLNRQPNY